MVGQGKDAELFGDIGEGRILRHSKDLVVVFSHIYILFFLNLILKTVLNISKAISSIKVSEYFATVKGLRNSEVSETMRLMPMVVQEIDLLCCDW
jgi:hypothetical protein